MCRSQCAGLYGFRRSPVFLLWLGGGRNPVKQAEEALHTNSLLIHTHLRSVLFTYDPLCPVLFDDISAEEENQTKTKKKTKAQTSCNREPLLGSHRFNSLLTAAKWGGGVTSPRPDVLRGVVATSRRARGVYVVNKRAWCLCYDSARVGSFRRARFSSVVLGTDSFSFLPCLLSVFDYQCR